LFAACWRRRHEWVDERLAAFEQQCREQARQEPEAHAQGYGAGKRLETAQKLQSRSRLVEQLELLRRRFWQGNVTACASIIKGGL
jgi:hypothetical protein